jgi:Domain of unknown function (DUF4431)
LVLFIARGVGQNCIKYGAPTTLTGTLSMKDEAGYNEFAVLRPASAICTVADPKDVKDATDPYYRKQTNISEVEAAVYGSDAASAALRDRLEKLTGYHVVIKGDLFPATTGYDRTNVMLRVQAVDATDASGRQALLKPKPEIKVKDVDVYDVTINAGKRLVIEAHESGSATPLFPPDQYLPRWMTGGEVLYVDCREGYERSLISTTEKDGGIRFDGDGLCGLSAFPKRPVIIKLRCTKKR